MPRRVVEVRVATALNRVHGMAFRWSLNPYRGCQHGCQYCYARVTHTYLDLDPHEGFRTVLLAKVNLLELLARELSRPTWRRETVAVGTATDPYQPIEGHYRLTRGALELLHAARTPVDLITKGTLVVRDVDLLARMSRAAGVTVTFSVPTVDEDLWRVLEPGTPPPRQRLRALSRLAAAGVRVGVGLAPVLPGLTDSVPQLLATVQAARDHGAAFVWSDVLNLSPVPKEVFLAFLARHRPSLVPLYRNLYRSRYAPDAYTRALQRRVRAVMDRVGLPPPQAHPPVPEQLTLGW